MLNKLFTNKTYTTDLSSDVIIYRLEEYLLKQDKSESDSNIKNYDFKFNGKIFESGFTLSKKSYDLGPFRVKAYARIVKTGNQTVLNLNIRPADYGITTFIFSAFMFYYAYTASAWPFFLFVALVLMIGIFAFLSTAKELDRFIRIELLSNNPAK